MGDFLLRSNDMIQFTCAPAVVPQLAAPIPLIGTGTTVLIGGQPACIMGDELPPAIAGPLTYTQANFTTPGMGKILKILLTPQELTKQTQQGGKQMLLKGGSFTATFQVSAPAMQPNPPAPPIPDPQLMKTFQVKFITTDTNVQAS
jgi:Contractile injection system spike tip protein